MAIVTGIVALAGAAYGAYDKNQQKKKAKKLNGFADRQGEMGEEQYNVYQRLYAPREREMLNDAFDQRRTVAAEGARAGAAAAAAGDNAERIGLRNARKVGINPSSPGYADVMREQQAGKAGLISSAKTFARREADDINFNRQNTLLQGGKGLVSNAMRANDSAFNMESSLADARAQRSAETGELFGQAAGYLTSGLIDYRANRVKKPVGVGPTYQV